MLKHPPLAALAAAALLALPLQALANDSWHNWREREYRWERHDNNHRPEKRLIEKYDRFAGSDENARELVQGLRNDSQIELSQGSKKTTFTPATNKMGYGNVAIALALAKASLAEHGIHKPTPEQIKAALNGGTVTTKSGRRVNLPGVLKLRASGMGWGQVAHKVGVDKKHDDRHHHKHAKHHDRDDDDDRHHHRKHAKHEHKHDKHDWKHDHKHHDRDHGDRHDHRKHAHNKHDWKHDHRHADKHHGHDWKHHKHAKHDRDHHQKPDWKHQRHEHKHERVKHHQHRPEFHRAKFERPDRAHRPEKVERPHRAERPERPERHHHRR